MELFVFILASVGILIIPGPNVLVIISTSLSQGKVRGLQVVAGTSAAMIIQLAVVALGTSYFISGLATGFVWLKWLGVAYLLYLGIRHLLAAYRQHPKAVVLTASSSFMRGFWISLTNPKTLLFFSAFLPQFTQASSAYLPQIALLSCLFWCLAVVLDSLYALLASYLSSWVQARGMVKYQNGVSGVMYCGAGSLLAFGK